MESAHEIMKTEKFWDLQLESRQRMSVQDQSLENLEATNVNLRVPRNLLMSTGRGNCMSSKETVNAPVFCFCATWVLGSLNSTCQRGGRSYCFRLNATKFL